METREQLLQFTSDMIAVTKVTDNQIRSVNSLISFRLSDDQIARIDQIINE